MSLRAFDTAVEHVSELYRENHARQTVDFVRAKRDEYLPLRKRRMSVWDAIDALEEVIDQSDPDTELTQLDHALQTAEALRASGATRARTLTGFIHDLGKVLCLFGEPQWAVVGDTFPVGCAFAPEVVHADLFSNNPDSQRAEYSTPNGIYRAGIGLDALEMSWGHDEYLFHVMRPYLPDDALTIIRYHSFYAAHAANAYRHLLCDADGERLETLREFSRFDLYSKVDDPPDREGLRPYYRELVSEFLPDTLQW